VRLLDRHREADHFGRTVLTLYADGKIDASAMKALMTAHEQDLAAKADVPKTMGTPKAPFSPG
jgi:hypothetical protein